MSGRTSPTFLQTRLFLSLGHVLHQRCLYFMPSRRVTKEVWQAYQEATYAFLSLFSGPDVLDKCCLKSLGRLIVPLYDKTSRMMKSDEARQQFFKQTESHNLPTQTGLTSTFCMLPTNFSGLRVWEKCIEKEQRLPDSTAWGRQGDKTRETCFAWAC